MLASKPPAAATSVEARTSIVAVAMPERRRQEHAVVDLEVEHFGVIANLDAELFGGQVQRVQHRPAAAEEERIGAPEAERAAERRLPAHALLDDPVQDVLGLADHVPRQLLVGLAAGDAQQIFPEFLFGIGPGEDVGRRVVGAAHVAGVAGIAAAIELRRAFQHQHRGAEPPRADRGAQRGVAAADHQHIVFTSQVDHALLLSLFAWKSNRAGRAARPAASGFTRQRPRGFRWSGRRDRP